MAIGGTYNPESVSSSMDQNPKRSRGEVDGQPMGFLGLAQEQSSIKAEEHTVGFLGIHQRNSVGTGESNKTFGAGGDESGEKGGNAGTVDGGGVEKMENSQEGSDNGQTRVIPENTSNVEDKGFRGKLFGFLGINNGGGSNVESRTQGDTGRVQSPNVESDDDFFKNNEPIIEPRREDAVEQTRSELPVADDMSVAMNLSESGDFGPNVEPSEIDMPNSNTESEPPPPPPIEWPDESNTVADAGSKSDEAGEQKSGNPPPEVDEDKPESASAALPFDPLAPSGGGGKALEGVQAIEPKPLPFDSIDSDANAPKGDESTNLLKADEFANAGVKPIEAPEKNPQPKVTKGEDGGEAPLPYDVLNSTEPSLSQGRPAGEGPGNSDSHSASADTQPTNSETITIPIPDQAGGGQEEKTNLKEVVIDKEIGITREIVEQIHRKFLDEWPDYSDYLRGVSVSTEKGHDMDDIKDGNLEFGWELVFSKLSSFNFGQEGMIDLGRDEYLNRLVNGYYDDPSKRDAIYYAIRGLAKYNQRVRDNPSYYDTTKLDWLRVDGGSGKSELESESQDGNPDAKSGPTGDGPDNSDPNSADTRPMKPVDGEESSSEPELAIGDEHGEGSESDLRSRYEQIIKKAITEKLKVGGTSFATINNALLRELDEFFQSDEGRNLYNEILRTGDTDDNFDKWAFKVAQYRFDRKRKQAGATPESSGDGAEKSSGSKDDIDVPVPIGSDGTTSEDVKPINPEFSKEDMEKLSDIHSKIINIVRDHLRAQGINPDDPASAQYQALVLNGWKNYLSDNPTASLPIDIYKQKVSVGEYKDPNDFDATYFSSLAGLEMGMAGEARGEKNEEGDGEVASPDADEDFIKFAEQVDSLNKRMWDLRQEHEAFIGGTPGYSGKMDKVKELAEEEGREIRQYAEVHHGKIRAWLTKLDELKTRGEVPDEYKLFQDKFARRLKSELDYLEKNNRIDDIPNTDIDDDLLSVSTVTEPSGTVGGKKVGDIRNPAETSESEFDELLSRVDLDDVGFLDDLGNDTLSSDSELPWEGNSEGNPGEEADFDLDSADWEAEAADLEGFMVEIGVPEHLRTDFESLTEKVARELREPKGIRQTINRIGRELGYRTGKLSRAVNESLEEVDHARVDARMAVAKLDREIKRNRKGNDLTIETQFRNGMRNLLESGATEFAGKELNEIRVGGKEYRNLPIEYQRYVRLLRRGFRDREQIQNLDAVLSGINTKVKELNATDKVEKSGNVKRLEQVIALRKKGYSQEDVNFGVYGLTRSDSGDLDQMARRNFKGKELKVLRIAFGAYWGKDSDTRDKVYAAARKILADKFDSVGGNEVDMDKTPPFEVIEDYLEMLNQLDRRHEEVCDGLVLDKPVRSKRGLLGLIQRVVNGNERLKREIENKGIDIDGLTEKAKQDISRRVRGGEVIGGGAMMAIILVLTGMKEAVVASKMLS